MQQTLVAIYTGGGFSVAATNILQIPAIGKPITGVYLDGATNSVGDALFSLKLDGAEVVASSSLKIVNGTQNVNVTGLSIANSLGSLFTLDLVSPLPTTMPEPPYSLILTYDDGQIASGGGNGFPGQDGIDGESWMIPGPAGAAGVAGATGAQGLPGAMGPSGEDGSQGEDGLSIPGPQGIQGVAGSTGAPGATGPAGAVGLPGERGDDGETIMIPGAQGPQGNPGATGPMGQSVPSMPGADGQDGEEWMIPGPAGPQGAAGSTTPSSTDTFTNKTLDFEGTGNSITVVEKVWMPAAGANGSTAAPFWDLPASAAPTPTDVAGTNVHKAVLSFADSGAQTAQTTLLLPADWTGNIDAKIVWYTPAVTGNCKWFLYTSFTDIGAASTDDNAYNAAQTVTTAAPGTANRITSSSISTLTSTGSGAGFLMHLKISRDGTDASDTIAAAALLVGLELTFRRTV